MTVKELINELNKIQNQDAEIILEDSILCLAVKLTGIRNESDWQDGAIDLLGEALPNDPVDWDEDEEI